MDRTEILASMGELKLYGMKAAYDEIVATAVKREHEPARVVGDLLSAEISESAPSRATGPSGAGAPGRARSSTRSPSPRCPAPRRSTSSPSRTRRSTRPWCPISPAATSSSTNATSCSSAGQAPERPTSPSASPAPASEAAREGRPGIALEPVAGNAGLFNVVDLVNKLEAEARGGKQGRTADLLGRLDFLVLVSKIPASGGTSSATCPSPRLAASCSST